MKKKSEPYKIIDGNPLHRQYEGYFLLDWETGKLRAVKTPRPIENSYVREIPIKYKIRVEMPEIPMQEMDVQIKLSERKITDIMVDAL